MTQHSRFESQDSMKHDEFIQKVQWQVSELAVGTSTLRNQGGSGLIKTAREYFKAIDLDCYGSTKNATEFSRLLDNDTTALKGKFPIGAQHWGAARKAMNLFLRDAYYNQFLCSQFGLGRIEQWLEVPLDSYVANGLIKDFRGKKYSMRPGFVAPKWEKIKTLKQSDSDFFQKMALALANELCIARVHIDLIYWRKKQ